MAKQVPQTRAEFYDQAKYDAWLASNPDTSQITNFWAFNCPGLTSLPDLPAVEVFGADNAIRALRGKKGAA